MKRYLCVFGLMAVLVTGMGVAQTSASPGVSLQPSTTVAKVKIPNVVGFRMDRATRTLRNAGLRVNEECSGFFGCIIKSRWWVCVQAPRAGRYVARYSVVVIYAERRGEC